MMKYYFPLYCSHFGRSVLGWNCFCKYNLTFSSQKIEYISFSWTDQLCGCAFNVTIHRSFDYLLIYPFFSMYYSNDFSVAMLLNMNRLRFEFDEYWPHGWNGNGYAIEIIVQVWRFMSNSWGVITKIALGIDQWSSDIQNLKWFV